MLFIGMLFVLPPTYAWPKKVKHQARLKNILVLISRKGEEATPHLLAEVGADPLFRVPQDYDAWSLRFRRKLVKLMRWKSWTSRFPGSIRSGSPTTRRSPRSPSSAARRSGRSRARPPPVAVTWSPSCAMSS